MARLPRAVMPGHPHLLIHQGHSGQPVFLDAADAALYLATLADAARAARLAVHAYALFVNEVRLLATPEAADGLAQLMQAVGRRYVPAFNRKYSRRGTPWEGRFRSAVVEPGPQFLACLRFIEVATPVRGSPGAGEPVLCSLAHHLGQRVDPLVADHPAFWAFGNTPFEREAAYRRFIEQPPKEGEVAAILLAARNGWALGSPAFRASVAQHAGRRVQAAARGRPRKQPQAVP
jgi:putative transposase